MGADPLDAIEEQFDPDAGEQTIEFDDDADMYHNVIPYTIGYMSESGYGVIGVGFVENTITVAPVE
jgi:hypothetical protein